MIPNMAAYGTDGKEMRIAERLMLQGIEVDDADLADSGLRLRDLAKR